MTRAGSDSGDEGALVAFDPTHDDGSLRVTDRVADRSLVVETGETPSLTPSDPDSFVFPVDDAVTCYADAITVSGVGLVTVLDESGDHVETATPTKQSVPRGTYYLSIEGVPRLYVRAFETSFSVVAEDNPGAGLDLRVSFDTRARLEIGARSQHDRPAETITVPDDPEAVRTAVGYLSANVKEWTAERSWPTIRGHPPAVELGDDLRVPDHLERPDTGVALRVPARYPAIYRAAPLAFYLGASLEPADGDDVVLHLENGYTESLGTGADLEASVDDLLARYFFLDSLVRTGGYYEFERYEYGEVAPSLSFYPPELYDASFSEQSMEYLEVPFADIEPYLPRWPLTATLRDGPRDVELLPALLHRLARVRVADGSSGPPDAAGIGSAVAYTTNETPRGGVRVSRAGFRHGWETPPQPRGKATVRLVDVDGDGARDALETVAAGNGKTDAAVEPEVVTAGTRAALRDALETPAACVVVGTPVDGTTASCADGGLALEDLDVAAATVLFADARGVDPAAATVDGGAGAAVAVDGSPRGVGRAVGYLTAGYAVTDAVQLAAIDPAWWAAGDPTFAPVADSGGGGHVHVEVTSIERDRHRTTRIALPGATGRLGSVSVVDDSSPVRLLWSTVTDDVTVDTDAVVDYATDADSVVTLNGDRLHDTRAVTRRVIDAAASRVVDGEQPTER